MTVGPSRSEPKPWGVVAGVVAGGVPTAAEATAYIENHLDSGALLPGFGHGQLRDLMIMAFFIRDLFDQRDSSLLRDAI